MSQLINSSTNRVVLLLLFVLVVGGVINHGSVSPNNLGIVVTQSVPVAAVALGTMLVLVTGAIDLSVGATTSLAAVVLARALAGGGGWGIPVVEALAAGAAVGAINAGLVAGLGLPSFVVTLGTLAAAGGVTIMVSGDISLIDNPLGRVASAHALGIRADVLIVVALALGVHVFLTRTRFGLGMRGVGSAEESARALGISARSTRAMAFLVSGTFAGITAALLVARTPVVTPQLGGSLLLDAFAATVIGGTSIFGGRAAAFGTLLGAVLITYVGNLLVRVGTSASTIESYRGAIILVALLLDALLTRVGQRHRREGVRYKQALG